MKTAELMREQAANRFWSYVDKREDGCWLWKRMKNYDGYGRFKVFNKTQYSHRFAWVLTNGEIPLGLLVLHQCDNPPCCNPEHLFLGTHTDNARDRCAKGRSVHPGSPGEKNGSSKLTESQVRSIRERHASGGISCKNLGLIYGICERHIRKICRRERWQFVAEQDFLFSGPHDVRRTFAGM